MTSPSAASHSINVAWLIEPPIDHYSDAWGKALDRLLRDDSWRAWLTEYVTLDNTQLLTVEDVESERLRVKRRTKEVDLTVPLTRLDEALQAGRLADELAEVARSIYVTWAERKGIPGPPPLP